DQIVAYARSINRFLWLILTAGDANGLNRLRLCSAQPPNLGVGNWTCWDITPASVNAIVTPIFTPFGTIGGCPQVPGCFDYPDMSVGSSELYISTDATWVRAGFMVMRIPLVDIQAGGTARMGYTNPLDGQSARLSHLAQNSASQINW